MSESTGSEKGKQAVIDLLRITSLISLTFTNRTLPRDGKERVSGGIRFSEEEYMKGYI